MGNKQYRPRSDATSVASDLGLHCLLGSVIPLIRVITDP